MLDVPDELVDELGPPVAAGMRLLLGVIPAGPAARLGRLGASEQARPETRHTSVRPGHRRVPLPPPRQPVSTSSESAKILGLRRLGALYAPRVPDVAGHPDQTPSEPLGLAALREVGPLTTERLLGALELTVTGMEPVDVSGLTLYLPPPPAGGRYGFASAGHDSEALTAALLLDGVRRGLADLVLALARRLAVHPSIVPLLLVAPDAADEQAVAAQHGRAHLALAVAVAHTVVGHMQAPPLADRAAATVGMGIGAAAVLLGQTPMPPAYGPALLNKIRAEYLLPRGSFGSVRVSQHRFGLVEGSFPETVDFAGNGLVAVVDGGAVIRTGMADGPARVQLSVLAEEPPEVVSGWEEIVEVSWHAAEGLASVLGPDGTGEPQLRAQTPPWPGDYRLRVHARGRDDRDDPDAETYELVVWAAPAAPEVVHRRTDRLGHRLRGEPEQARPARPEHAYRWVRRSLLSGAATVTVTTGATVEEVLRAFGADPDRPESIRSIEADLYAGDSNFPWVAVLDAGPAILAVEYNGFQGSRESVLRRASARGRAASMFWNVNALMRLSFAEQGRLLAAFEPGMSAAEPEVDAEPAVAAATAGLELADHVDRHLKGLVAVERFTGYGITAADLDRVTTAGTGFRIISLVDDL
ncbi:DUF6461 domain-containing protein [Micromonospora avicenniae]|uniref:DUF6461 domain-containing protein n=1 Tax=Micromonospora avicenniae TaxID=1198245 RepID=UPI0033282F96